MNSNIQLSVSVDALASLDTALLGRLLSQAPANERLAKSLHSLPSETVPEERNFLYHFFQRIWCGDSDVLEIGPFLGGSSRAIAYGMLHSPRREPDVRLHTYDKFTDYKDPDRLMATLEPLFAAGFLSQEDRAGCAGRTDFLGLFRRLHGSAEYAELVVPHEARLPDLPQQVGSIPNPFRPQGDAPLGAVFVDGCKSWYGTRYFMSEIAERLAPEAYLLFQDHGLYTCFWIPAFTGIMHEFLRPITYVGDTYVFQLAHPFMPADIEQRFPESPEEFGRQSLDLLFRQMAQLAMRRNESRWMLNLSLQRASALAYLGHHDEARAILHDITERPYFADFRDLIEAAARCPTYRPEGSVYL